MGADAALVPKRRLLTWAFNPFHYLSGEKALPLGLGFIAATALLGFFTRTHVDGVLDVHTGPAAPLWFHFAEGLVDWTSLGLLLAGIGLLVSRSRPRFIDTFGMQALARAPFLAAVGLTSLIPECVAASVRNTGSLGECGRSDIAALIALSLSALLFVIWAVVLMYNAYSVACNVSGGRGVASFIVAILLAEVLSKVVIRVLAQVALAAP